MAQRYKFSIESKSFPLDISGEPKNKVGKEMANYTTGYFTYKAATGIDAPTVSDDTAAEYYDLQGRRLNAPQKGVNIVKRGKKTTKILVK